MESSPGSFWATNLRWLALALCLVASTLFGTIGIGGLFLLCDTLFEHSDCRLCLTDLGIFLLSTCLFSPSLAWSFTSSSTWSSFMVGRLPRALAATLWALIFGAETYSWWPTSYFAFFSLWLLSIFMFDSIAMLLDLLKVGSYWDFGSLSVICPRLRGHLMVDNKSWRTGTESWATSIFSNVPVIWFRSPCVPKILSQLGLEEGFTCKRSLTISLRSELKWGGIGSYCPLVTFWLRPYILFALKGGSNVIIS